MPFKISRSTYADIYGPTTGDKVRLADTSLVLQVENDFAVYGDECKFGGGKTIREGMGQAAGVGDRDALDCVITPQPVYMRPMFGSLGRARGGSSLAFISAASLPQVSHYNLAKKLEPVRNCRTIGKRDMKLNDVLPTITVDPETYRVTADGDELTCEPSVVLPLAQRHFLF